MRGITWRVCVLVCLAGSAAQAADRLPVAVSILPQRFFVEHIGGEHVRVSVMVVPGASPATYEPAPRQMAALARTRLYLAIGVPFESAWLARMAAVAPEMHIVRIDAPLQRMPLGAHAHEHHRQHDGDGMPDPHVWLSPPHVRVMAAVIRDSLIECDPGHAAQYLCNYESFAREINRCDAAILSALSHLSPARRRFMVYHPSWGYFARTYALEQMPVEVSGREPGPRSLQASIQQARTLGVRAIFVQPQFSQKSARTIAAAVGARVLVADPLAYAWADNLVAIAHALAASLQ